MNILLQLGRELGKRSFFYALTRFVRPELIMACLYIAIWIDPLVFGLASFQGFRFGIGIEFILAHSQVFIAMLILKYPVDSKKGKLITALLSFIYLLFVAGISFAMGTWLTTIFFLILTIKRITTPQNDTDIGMQMWYSFFKLMIMVLAAGLAAILAYFIPAQISGILEITEGGEVIPAFGVCYFVGIYFYEKHFVEKILNPAKLEKV